MFGARLTARFADLARRHLCAGLILLALLSGARAEIITSNSATPAVPANPIAPGLPAEPPLPADPTAPSAFSTPGAPGIPLIPTEPLAPPDPPPSRRPSETSLSNSRVGALPGGLTPEPFAAPPDAAAPPPGAVPLAANDIGAARRFQYNFGLTIGATYDTNIFLEHANPRDDLYFSIQPTLSLGFGGGKAGGNDETVVRFTYSPEALLYLGHSELDTIQHFIALTGSHRFARLTLSGGFDVQILDSTDVGNPHPYDQSSAGGGLTGSPIVNTPSSNVNLDVGQRTRQNLYSVALRGNYLVSDKVSYEVAGQFGVTDYVDDALLSSRALSGSAFFNYSPTGKTTLGLGATLGYVLSDGENPDQSFEQANLRVAYLPSDKLNFAGQIGLEFRQAGHGGTEFTPVFDLNASYNPFDGTSISLVGSRRVLTSAVVGGQNYNSTTLSLTLNQRLYQRFFLHLSVGYTNSDYVAEADGSGTGRQDNYFFLQPGVDFKIHENIFVGLFYTYRRSDSTLVFRDFSDQQTGLRASVSY